MGVGAHPPRKKPKQNPIFFSKENETLIRKGICTPVFPAALFTAAETREQTQHCPSIDEWVKTCTMEYYSAIDKKEVLPSATTRTELEGIMLSEIS